MGKNSEQNIQKRYKRKKKLKVLLIVIAGALLIMLSPMFTIKNIQITQMDKYSKEEICDMLNLHEGNNLFLFNRIKAAR